jgi:hypothetical protein
VQIKYFQGAGLMRECETKIFFWGCGLNPSLYGTHKLSHTHFCSSCLEGTKRRLGSGALLMGMISWSRVNLHTHTHTHRTVELVSAVVTLRGASCNPIHCNDVFTEGQGSTSLSQIKILHSCTHRVHTPKVKIGQCCVCVCVCVWCHTNLHQHAQQTAG